jgi:hypothetical protein
LGVQILHENPNQEPEHMPVSKKRKKEGKAVQRSEPVVLTGPEHDHGPEAKAGPPPFKAGGKPSNPFTAKRMVRSAQRGR